MKTETNFIKKNKNKILFFKIFLWISLGLLFMSISILVPTNPDNIINEFIVFVCLCIMININVSYLYPIVFKKSKLGYIALLVVSIFICAYFEMLIFKGNFGASYYALWDKKLVHLVVFGYVCIRDLALFIFFTWVEYFNRLIHFYYKQEQIHQKEITLLIEKQNFEKNFSRKKLLPHYFFNILEYIYAKTLINNSNDEIFDKLKFVLYYFLVDAEKEKIELDKEIAFYKCYIDLENFRHQKNVSVNFNVLGETENFTIIPLLIEPLINNAMKYTKYDGTGWVDITVDATSSPVLNFLCRNNYTPHSSNIISSENGLKIFKQRLYLCYKDNYNLKIEQNEDLYEISLSVTVK